MTIYQLKPQAQDQRNVSQQDILDNFTYLQTSVGHDHNFTNDSTATNDGLHKHSTYFVTTAPVTATDQVATYTANDAYAQPQLWMQPFNSAVTLNPIQLTAGNPTTGATQVPQITNTTTTANSGATFLPGGLLLQWKMLLAKNGDTITFPIDFKIGGFTPIIICNDLLANGFAEVHASTSTVPVNVQHEFVVTILTDIGAPVNVNRLINFIAIGLA